MAFKLTVDFNKLSLVVQTDAAEPTTTFIYAQSSVTHTHAEAVSAYTLMSFSDVFLDPDTKNLYFTCCNHKVINFLDNFIVKGYS